MASEVQICNLALSHLGVGKEIASLTENSSEAAACNRFFTIVRDNVLRDHPWSFATKFLTLALVESNPTTEWGYSYTYPVDCLFFRRILSGIRNDTRQSRASSRITSSTASLMIYTDVQDAVAEYTFRETNSERFSAGFTMAFSYLLAEAIAPQVSGGDPFNLKAAAARSYILALTRAEANDINEQQDEEHPEAEAIRARE